ncbi:outer membrane beta-barrel protein [Confluentibacter citreus]|uniref:outer membrane beta-barrel protein n=1 Tax=Confluentibacter citreus TaxID=2007307 RepID=UPI000C28EC44|nr:outer membrane beta-barrel protein [Confluentibacter citreus]
MKQILIIVVIMFTTHAFSQSQSIKISGKLLSEEGNVPLESATVYLERVKDSSMMTYTITDRNGLFSLENKTGDSEFNFFISFVGYETYFKKITLDSPEINLGTINLKIDTNALDEVIVRSTAPVVIKRDTLEFNTDSFKIKKDANVEDLLKELPGVEVAEDGTIKVNGKTVNRVLVNGKPFFGNDPTITTRNLTKDIIDKIQVTDTKTDAQAFSGEEGDRENQTINLVIKKDKNQGVFGRVAAGAGTDDRYEYAGMFNYFNDDQRLSILAGENNINSPGFSFGEIQKMLGGGNSISVFSNGGFVIDGRSFGAGEGIVTSRSIGANYADELGKKLDVSANYFNSKSDSENESITNRENILPDRRFFNNSTFNTITNNDTHNMGMELKIKPDSTLLITVQPKFGFSKNENIYNGEEQSFDESQALINESSTESFTANTAKNFSNNMDFTKRFGSKGSFLRMNIYNDNNTNQIDDYLMNEINTYGNNPENTIRNQYRSTDDRNHSFYSSLTYRLPVKGKELYMDFKYEYRNLVTEKNLNSFDFNEATQDFSSVRIDSLSTDFKNINILNSPSVSLGYRDDKLSASAEFKLVYRNLENTDAIRPDFDLTRKFDAVEFIYNLNYRFSPQKSLYVYYRLKNNAPNISQLQAFSDVTNPLNVITGNPFLTPTNVHSFYAYYNTFNLQKNNGFTFYISSDIQNNNVVAKQTINEELKRETTYVNVNGAYSLSGSINYNRKVKIDSLKTVDFFLGIYPRLTRSVNFNNDVQYTNLVKSIQPNIGARFVWKDVMEFRPNYFISYTQNTYSLENLNDQDLVYHGFNLSTVGYFSKKLEWRNDFRYTYNPNIADGFQKSLWFWNSTLAYSIMKNNATLTLKAYDLLNQNTNARRTVNENYIQDSQNTVLRQYFMVGFSWKFNTLGKAGETNSGGMMMGY